MGGRLKEVSDRGFAHAGTTFYASKNYPEILKRPGYAQNQLLRHLYRHLHGGPNHAVPASTDFACSNVVVVRTASEGNARKILALKSIGVNGKEHEVAVYAAAEGNYLKGVNRNVEHPRRRPRKAHLKCNKETGSIVEEKMYEVTSESARQYLYKKQIEVRMAIVCHNCGAKHPKQGHSVQVRSKLCRKGHATGDKAYKQKYQTHFVVRQRRKEQEMERAFYVDLPDFRTLEARQPRPP
ncbi:hypothetical protein HPB52_004856 [Rhipicephalus sanguineus]|uniref:Uncharacterized protein n=1 Tax=Rhipicephalus sanguineus TaxID=34632 RepID=A0A9D4SVP5_RHISA|nr:hypothetical protein HPB52_004856 [Rhipicephalus sanguineus]